MMILQKKILTHCAIVLIHRLLFFMLHTLFHMRIRFVYFLKPDFTLEGKIIETFVIQVDLKSFMI